MEQLIDQYAWCDSNMFSLLSSSAECGGVAVTGLCQVCLPPSSSADIRPLFTLPLHHLVTSMLSEDCKVKFGHTLTEMTVVAFLRSYNGHDLIVT